MLMAKIETPEGIAQLDEIIKVSNTQITPFLLTGDLGVRVPLEDVPHLQKEIIRHGTVMPLPVVVATQMLESA